MSKTLRQRLFGRPLSPFNPKTRENLLLIALFAWVGLGADALSSTCYGPEEAFLALGIHSSLAIFVCILTVVTIFIISIGYNQVIELFPGGGGGYRVATTLLHPYVGLIAGCALLVDYVLTITVSAASGTDAVFSFLPLSFIPYKIYVEVIVLSLLMFLNFRGMKDSIKTLFPIFMLFLILHVGIIIFGIAQHSSGLNAVLPSAWNDAQNLVSSTGWLAVIGLTLHAYSLGGGTYTGLESVSNNIQHLTEPRVQTGKRTMFYMATSLSFMAGGMILLFMLYDAKQIPGQTLNATVFSSILGQSTFAHGLWLLILISEAALLLVAANTGFLAGPIVLANMAVDNWVPSRFRLLSKRLVVENGLLLFGVASIAILLLTGGNVPILIVLYSINVFITFTLSLLGISRYWIKHRRQKTWPFHFLIASIACFVTASILGITLYYKFSDGGWLTLVITFSLVGLCTVIKSHYRYITKRMRAKQSELAQALPDISADVLAINPKDHTAIIFANELSIGMHSLRYVLQMFPHQFKNFIFLTVGVVDTKSFESEKELERMQIEVNLCLEYFIAYCRQNGFAAAGYSTFGTDHIEELEHLIDKVSSKYPNSVFFSTHLIFKHDNMFIRLLHNQTSGLLQDYLHGIGKELVIVPMRI